MRFVQIGTGKTLLCLRARMKLYFDVYLRYSDSTERPVTAAVLFPQYITCIFVCKILGPGNFSVF